jgi:hypothetical protein
MELVGLRSFKLLCVCVRDSPPPSLSLSLSSYDAISKFVGHVMLVLNRAVDGA